MRFVANLILSRSCNVLWWWRHCDVIYEHQIWPRCH